MKENKFKFQLNVFGKPSSEVGHLWVFFLNMQSSSYLGFLNRTSVFSFINKQTNSGPQVMVFSSVKVFMYQINENCHETYLNIYLLSLRAANFWFTHCPWTNFTTCLKFVKQQIVYLSCRNSTLNNFKTSEFSLELYYFNMVLLLSGMFRRITAAATRLFTGDGSDGSFYTLESLSDLVQSMIPTHPSLVLLWCHILLLVNYTNYNWWSEVHQTPK